VRGKKDIYLINDIEYYYVIYKISDNVPKICNKITKNNIANK
jgi:hypothetical protein